MLVGSITAKEGKDTKYYPAPPSSAPLTVVVPPKAPKGKDSKDKDVKEKDAKDDKLESHYKTLDSLADTKPLTPEQSTQLQDACNAIVSAMNETDLAVFMATKSEEPDKSMEAAKKKYFLALKTLALREISENPESAVEACKKLSKWVDVESSEYVEVAVYLDCQKKAFAQALKKLRKHLTSTAGAQVCSRCKDN
mgnify:CR=1 FL=1